ncbi:MAG: Flagellar brake protein YcgR [Phycisphaerae bacterium]|nr:Flagellar brake protein YcgR [Phycisphaerae bacterium]
MNSVTTVEADVRENLLGDAAARNLAADLVVVQGENLQANLKSRFLQHEPDRLLLEVPSHNGRPVVLQPGQFVEVYFKVGNERFGFDSRVVGYTRVDLNEQTAVEALVVAPPHFLERRQRRKFYRISVATLPTIDCRLWPVDADPSRAPAVKARLCNISAGGVAVLLDGEDSCRFVSDESYRLRFSLPEGQWAAQDEAKQFEFEAVACHVRHVFQNRRMILGLAFLPGGEPVVHRKAIEAIARFVTAHQREQLFQTRRRV